jgi:predicted dehydrogenase
MRFLICGLGSIGQRHLRNLQALGQKDIVLLRNGKSTLPDDELAGLQIEHDLAQALERWRPDAVVISNPTALHLGVAIAAAEAGCNLLIEKSVSDTMEGITELQIAL